MLTAREQWLKWSLYAALTAALTLLAMLTLRDVRVLGARLVLPPLFVGVVASLESPRAGMLFALVYGVLCDVSVGGVFPCVHTLAFPLAALVCAFLAQRFLQPGFVRSLASAAAALFVLDALNMLWLRLTRGAALPTMLALTAREEASCLLLVALYPPLRWVHRKFTL